MNTIMVWSPNNYYGPNEFSRIYGDRVEEVVRNLAEHRPDIIYYFEEDPFYFPAQVTEVIVCYDIREDWAVLSTAKDADQVVDEQDNYALDLSDDYIYFVMYI